jgi:hypothetical protein
MKWKVDAWQTTRTLLGMLASNGVFDGTRPTSRQTALVRGTGVLSHGQKRSEDRK